MSQAGVDVSAFQSHILRSASMQAAIAAGEDVDLVLQRASVSLKVFKVFYQLPIGGQSEGGVESLDGAAASKLLLGLQQPVSAEPSDAADDPLCIEDG